MREESQPQPDAYKTIWQGKPLEIEFGYQRRDGKRSFRRVRLSKVLEDDKQRLCLYGFCSKRRRERLFYVAGLTTNIRFLGENYEPETFIAEMLMGGKAVDLLKEEKSEEGIAGWLWPMGAAVLVSVALAAGGYWYIGLRKPGLSPAKAAVRDSTPAAVAIEEPSAVAVDSPENRIPVVDDNTVNEFIYRFSQDYVEMSMKLIKGYYRFEKNHDFNGFETFKTMEWLPEYQVKQMYYNSVQERNWEYMFYHGLTQLTADFLELVPSSNDLWFVLKNLDNTKLEVVRNRFARVKNTLEDLDRKRGLKLGDILSELEIR